jgi:hypothetical protein
VCRPLRLASLRNVTRARECTTAGFFIINPSLYNFDILRRELANLISFVSFGSNQILRFPHFNTDDAKRFCNFNETIRNYFSQRGKIKRYDDKIVVSYCEDNIHGRNLASNQTSNNLVQQRYRL